MLVDDIAQAIWLAENRHYNHVHTVSRPVLTIYMSREARYEALNEIRGMVSTVAMEFVDQGTILGYPVFVADQITNTRGVQISHPHWKVTSDA